MKPCPLCAGRRARQLADVGWSRVLRCLACGLIFMDPPAAPADVRAYYDRTYADAGARARIDAGRRALFLDYLARAPAGGRRLLDVGAGSGEFVALAAARGWEARGVEVSREAVEVARERGVPVALGADVGGRWVIPFPDGSFDVATLWNVVEFFERPAEQLAEVGRVLAPGGVVFVRAVNAPFQLLGYRARRLLRGPGALARILARGYVFHPLLWSVSPLRALLERAGFADVRVWNSPVSRGDPYGAAGPRRAPLVHALKRVVYGAAQAAYTLSAGRLVLGSSLQATARKPA